MSAFGINNWRRRWDHKRIALTVRPGSDARKRAEVIHEWHKRLLHEAVPPIIQGWERKLKVEVHGYFLQRMKTKLATKQRTSPEVSNVPMPDIACECS
jgi:predicted metal-dependent hydrolase